MAPSSRNLTPAVARAAGKDLYNWYPRLQETITREVLLPRLEKMGDDEVKQKIKDSKKQLEALYKGDGLDAKAEKLIKYCMDKKIALTNETNGEIGLTADTVKNWLKERHREIKGVIDELKSVCSLAQNKELGNDGIGAVSRLFWPLLFYRPEESKECWTWPPPKKFVTIEMEWGKTTASPNTYLPTVFSLYPEPSEFSAAIELAIRFAHADESSGNSQVIDDTAGGVAAFKDAVVDDVDDVDKGTKRGEGAEWYDLLLGVRSTLMATVETDVPDNEKAEQGLLVLCSPLFKLFSEEDIQLCKEQFKKTEGPVVLGDASALYSAFSALKAENKQLRSQLQVYKPMKMIGSSAPMEAVKEKIEKIAQSRDPVLIRGESGVGKELVARAVYFAGPPSKGPFACLNCAALSETLLESELFGHQKGAFTGATELRVGKFEGTDQGTLFLDEIGEMSPSIQAKFLRVLEGYPFERVGGNENIQVDVRVIAATNRDLQTAVSEGTFREDLFYRLGVLNIVVPPLRERSEDILELAEHFLADKSKQLNKEVKGFTPEAEERLTQHPWPGNVRELSNVVSSAVVMTDNKQLEAEDITFTSLDTAAESGESPLPQDGKDKLEQQKALFEKIKSKLPNFAEESDAYREDLIEAVKSELKKKGQEFKDVLFLEEEAWNYLREKSGGKQGRKHDLWKKTSLLKFIVIRNHGGSLRSKCVFFTELDLYGAGKLQHTPGASKGEDS